MVATFLVTLLVEDVPFLVTLRVLVPAAPIAVGRLIFTVEVAPEREVGLG